MEGSEPRSRKSPLNSNILAALARIHATLPPLIPRSGRSLIKGLENFSSSRVVAFDSLPIFPIVK
jgi:hypothetical protein